VRERDWDKLLKSLEDWVRCYCLATTDCSLFSCMRTGLSLSLVTRNGALKIGPVRGSGEGPDALKVSFFSPTLATEGAFDPIQRGEGFTQSITGLLGQYFEMSPEFFSIEEPENETVIHGSH